jgi:sugar/nucleoside kinase (ribokinase family)
MSQEKKYDVYAVGNALVDKEFEVSDAFFATHGIEKGLMTLVEGDEQARLIEILMAEHGLKKRAGGGSAANTLYALSQFGGRAFYSCKLGNDETGDFFLSQLGDQNIETNTESQRADGVSGRCVVMISPDAERTMHTHLGVSGSIDSSDLDLNAADQAKYIYLEGYLVTSPSARAAIIELKEYAQSRGVNTAMTFSDPSMLEYFRDNINEVLGTGVDLLFCNERELRLWAQTDDFETAFTKAQGFAKKLAVTLGAKGALLFDGQRRIPIAPNAVNAIDTNGAGDMFAGAFLYGITNGMDFETAGNLASLASAKVVSNFGPRLTPEEHTAILA